MGPILWVLHFFLDVLQACVLQDLPAVARYVVLSVAAVAVMALAFYALAPPTILQYCEQAQDEARSLLAHASVSPGFRSGHSPGASDADDVQYNPLSTITSRRVSYRPASRSMLIFSQIQYVERRAKHHTTRSLGPVRQSNLTRSTLPPVVLQDAQASLQLLRPCAGHQGIYVPDRVSVTFAKFYH